MTSPASGRRNGLPYREGDWFAVPLRDGDWAVGLVARKKPRARFVLGYFFGPRRQTLPDLSELARLSADDAIWISRFAAHGMIRGDWPVLGPHPAWDGARWPMPAFCSRYPERNIFVRREYPDDDPRAPPVRQTRISEAECARLPRDGTSFVGAVEIWLTHLLPKAGPRPYREGDWFAIPLRGGGWALGLIARVPPSGDALLGYFFGPRRDDQPTLGDVEDLTAEDAILACRFDDLGLRSIRADRCPLLSQPPGWERERWPVPPFVRRDPWPPQWYLLACDDDDPGIVVAELPISEPDQQGFALHGPYSLRSIADILDWRWTNATRRLQRQSRRGTPQSGP